MQNLIEDILNSYDIFRPNLDILNAYDANNFCSIDGDKLKLKQYYGNVRDISHAAPYTKDTIIGSYGKNIFKLDLSRNSKLIFTCNDIFPIGSVTGLHFDKGMYIFRSYELIYFSTSCYKVFHSLNRSNITNAKVVNKNNKKMIISTKSFIEEHVL